MALFSSRRKQAIDEKREPIEVDENKIPKININNKKMKDFVLKAIGGIVVNSRYIKNIKEANLIMDNGEMYPIGRENVTKVKQQWLNKRLL